MKKVRLFSLVLSIALVLSLVAVLSACGSGTATTSSGASKSSSVVSTAKNYITKADYDQIQNGMSYEDVVKIIGSDGEQMSETGTKGDEYYTVVYDWKGKDGASNAVMEFQGDKLQTKSQIGLQ